MHLLELNDVRVPEHAVDEDLPLDVAPVGLYSYEQVTDEPASEAAAAPPRRPQQRLGFTLVSRFNTISSSQCTDGSELEQHHDAGGFQVSGEVYRTSGRRSTSLTATSSPVALCLMSCTKPKAPRPRSFTCWSSWHLWTNAPSRYNADSLCTTHDADAVLPAEALMGA